MTLTTDLIHVNLPIKVCDMATYLPATRYSNVDILKRLIPDKKADYYVEMADKIEQKYGFSVRYFARFPGEADGAVFGPLSETRITSESLAMACVGQLSKQSTSELLSIVFGSTTAARYTGATSAALGGKLNTEAFCEDIKSGCATSLAALFTAYGHLALGLRRSLVVCAELLSGVIGTQTRENYFGLADGAAALVLERNETDPQFIVRCVLHGSRGQFVDVYTSRCWLPPTAEDLLAGRMCLEGDSVIMKEVTLQAYADVLEQLQHRGVLAGITHVIPHQVNVQMLQPLFAKYELWDKRVCHANSVGNLGGTGVLYSLASSLQDGIFQKGNKLLMLGVGGGLSFGAQIWEKI